MYKGFPMPFSTLALPSTTAQKLAFYQIQRFATKKELVRAHVLTKDMKVPGES